MNEVNERDLDKIGEKRIGEVDIQDIIEYVGTTELLDNIGFREILHYLDGLLSEAPTDKQNPSL